MSEDNKFLNKITEAIELKTKVECIYKILKYENPKIPIINFEMEKTYGLNKHDLISSFIEYFYQKGLDDAMKNTIVVVNSGDLKALSRPNTVYKSPI